MFIILNLDAFLIVSTAFKQSQQLSFGIIQKT